jgi:hypothetical protein
LAFSWETGLRLWAQIVVDITASNFVEAAEHQNYLERCLKDIQKRYPMASLQMRERRERRHRPADAAKGT